MYKLSFKMVICCLCNFLKCNLVFRVDVHYLQRFNLIIASNPTPSVSSLLAATCWEQSVPLVIVRSFGFIGTYVFQSKEEIGIIESRPDAELPDLRLNAPFPELEVVAPSPSPSTSMIQITTITYLSIHPSNHMYISMHPYIYQDNR